MILNQMPLLKIYNKIRNEEYFFNIPIYLGYIKEEDIPKEYDRFIILTEESTLNATFASDIVKETLSEMLIIIYFKEQNPIELMNEAYFRVRTIINSKNQTLRTSYTITSSVIDYDTNFNLPRIVFTCNTVVPL